MGLTAFSLSNIWFALETADEEHSIFDFDVLLANATLLKTVGMSLVAILLATELNVFHRILDTVSLTLDQWAICFVVSLAMLVVAEGRKLLGIHTVEPARQNIAAPVPVPGELKERPMVKISNKRIAQFIEPFRVKPGSKVRLPHDFDPERSSGLGAPRMPKRLLAQGVELLADYQARLAAQDTYGLLVVLQAMDAAGKDGTIRHVMSGVNPQGVSVHSFKVPVRRGPRPRLPVALPAGCRSAARSPIFNRSHYEEVLVVRVHPEFLKNQKLPPSLRRGKDIWQRRYRSINDWERHLVENGIRVVKLFLNVVNEEQRRRFLSRIDEPEKNWKFSTNDAKERTFWNDYQKAFAEVLCHTSTEWAPWYVIPADSKPFARVAAAAVIANALIDIDPQYPTVSKEQRDMLQGMRAQLGGPDTGDGHHADTAPAGAAEAVAVNDKKKS